MLKSRALLSIVALLAILVGLAVPVASAELRAEDLPKVSVMVDGKILDADAYIVNDRTVVPLRAIFTALGAEVGWDAATRTVTGTKGGRVIKLTIDQTEAYVDGKPVALSVPAIIINSRTFVPLRFIGEALDAKVSFDSATRTVIVETGAVACAITGGQKHTGTISPGGETWTQCGSPHIISGTFLVAGADNPVLTIEAGVLVQFEARGRIDVSNATYPGGLVVRGTAEKPVVMTSSAVSPKAGDWDGIHFNELTLNNSASIENARIEYAGGATQYSAAVYAAMGKGDLPITLKNVEIKNALGAGLRLWGGARLENGSGNITITGTQVANEYWGHPVITDAVGVGSLPSSMTLTGNALNAINLTSGRAMVIDRDTTLRNLKVPYVLTHTLLVEGVQNPTLTIEPGVIMLFPKLSGLLIGQDKPGTLVADATSRSIEAWNGRYRSLLDDGANLANGKSILSGNPGWATNQAIVFGSSDANPAKGAWNGIQFMRNASTGNKLAGVVVNWAGGVRDDTAAIQADGQTVQLSMEKSMVANSAQNGIRFWADAEFTSFTGNYLTGNVDPLTLFPNAAGSIGTGNDFTGNTNNWIDIIGTTPISKSQTWLNHGVPYHLTQIVNVSGSANPVLTIAPGTTLLSATDRGLRVGNDSNGTGTLVAVGTADQPIIFSSDLKRPGTWEGITFGARAGAENKIEFAKIMYAKTGVTLKADLGAFMKNLTIANSSSFGIYRAYPTTGTDFTKEATIQFDANAANQR